MKSIELVGPSGIGKSTFLRDLLHHRDPNSTWCTGQEILKDLRYEKANFLEKALIKGGEIFGANLKTNRNYISKIQEHKAHCTPIIELFLNYLNNSDLESWQKVRLFDYYLKTTLYEKLLIMETGPEKLIIFDEGIIVNGGILSIRNNGEYRNITSSILFPKGVIYCDLNISDYRDRIHSRFIEKRERNINPLITNISEEEIEDYINYAKEVSRKKLEVCKDLDIPVLEIQPFLSKENLNKVLKFIDQMDNGKSSKPKASTAT